jgi:hypothetical protein
MNDNVALGVRVALRVPTLEGVRECVGVGLEDGVAVKVGACVGVSVRVTERVWVGLCVCDGVSESLASAFKIECWPLGSHRQSKAAVVRPFVPQKAY